MSITADPVEETGTTGTGRYAEDRATLARMLQLPWFKSTLAPFFDGGDRHGRTGAPLDAGTLENIYHLAAARGRAIPLPH